MLELPLRRIAASLRPLHHCTPRPVIAYMDAPCLANCFVTLCSIGEVATVHSDFDVLFCTVPDGFSGSDPKRGNALEVLRNDRVFPTLGLTEGAFYRFDSLRNSGCFSLTLIRVRGVLVLIAAAVGISSLISLYGF